MNSTKTVRRCKGPAACIARRAAGGGERRRSAGRRRPEHPGSTTRDQLRGVGVMVAGGAGSQDFTEHQYQLYYSGNQKQCSVDTIPTGTIGTLASEVSMPWFVPDLVVTLTAPEEVRSFDKSNVDCASENS